jgi:hypothetical protein
MVMKRITRIHTYWGEQSRQGLANSAKGELSEVLEYLELSGVPVTLYDNFNASGTSCVIWAVISVLLLSGGESRGSVAACLTEG